MTKKIFYLSGLPRTGSTVLANLLAQNPTISSTTTSSVPTCLQLLKNNYWQLSTTQAMPQDEAVSQIIGMMKGILYGSVEHMNTDVVLSQGRDWVQLIETLDLINDGDVRIIATVRGSKQITASLEKLYQKTEAIGRVQPALQNPNDFLTMRSRATHWLQKGMVGLSHITLVDAIERGHSDKILVIDYDDFVDAPKTTMEKVYNHLGIEFYNHDFKNIEQVLEERDTAYLFHPDLHTIGSELVKSNNPINIPEGIIKDLGLLEKWSQ